MLPPSHKMFSDAGCTLCRGCFKVYPTFCDCSEYVHAAEDSPLTLSGSGLTQSSPSTPFLPTPLPPNPMTTHESLFGVLKSQNAGLTFQFNSITEDAQGGFTYQSSAHFQPQHTHLFEKFYPGVTQPLLPFSQQAPQPAATQFHWPVWQEGITGQPFQQEEALFGETENDFASWP